MHSKCLVTLYMKSDTFKIKCIGMEKGGKSLTVKSLKLWNSLPKKVGEATSFEKFKTGLDRTVEQVLEESVLH